MSFMGNFYGRLAASKQSKGLAAEASAMYEKAIGAGMNNPSIFLAYSILLLRTGEFEKAKDVLLKLEKHKGLTDPQRQQLHMNYAVACYKLGDLPKALSILERQDVRMKSGLIYNTLGYLYVESGDAQKALAYNKEALAYDDEDPISNDNMGQTLYRLTGDKAAAKPYFEKALAEKPTAIDTNYFLAQYDLDAGDKDAAIAKLKVALSGRSSPLNYATPDKIKAELTQLGVNPDEE